MLSTLKCLGFSSRGLCVFENPPFLFISLSSLKLQRIKAEKAEITRFFQKPKTPQAPKVSTQRFPLAFFSVSVRLLLLKTNTVPLPSQPAFRQRGSTCAGSCCFWWSLEVLAGSLKRRKGPSASGLLHELCGKL